MPDNVANMLSAARRSMEQMIVPALENANPLAREQAQLIVQALGFVESRLPYLHAKNRAEMLAYAAIARQVLALDLAGADETIVAALRHNLDVATQLETDVDAPSRELQQAGQKLAEALAVLVRTPGALSRQSRLGLRKAIVSGSERVLDIHRAFFLPTGFDKAASSLPALATLLHGEDRVASSA